MRLGKKHFLALVTAMGTLAVLLAGCGGSSSGNGSKLPDAPRDFLRSFADQLVVAVELITVLVVVDGGEFTLFARNPSELGLYFLRREQAANVGNKSRQLPGKLCPGGRRINKVEQFLGDEVIECRFHPIAELDCVGGIALLNPNLVKFPGVHRSPLCLIIGLALTA